MKHFHRWVISEQKIIGRKFPFLYAIFVVCLCGSKQWITFEEEDLK